MRATMPSRAGVRRILLTLTVLILHGATPWPATALAGAPATTPASLIELRRHTELAMARGDYRAAEMLVETYLPAAQRLAEPTWLVFNAHLVATRIKLALDKVAEAEGHALQLDSVAAAAGSSDDAMERAIAAITLSQVRQRQDRSAEAADLARQALAILRRAHERGRITRQTFERERLAYEEVLIAAGSGEKSAPALR
ncbi:MAG: hypothetical protein KJ787_03000 [Gammaproteobacteria bacterium]|nr:hypothetical protein [Gammaproteobacteria bacterium]MBU1645281.1 hypothetical protein [Gammaproteobacteria bacterium]MBU1971618.1 hypothetical protein [Gammaproteobacteria bacterium]